VRVLVDNSRSGNADERFGDDEIPERVCNEDGGIEVSSTSGIGGNGNSSMSTK
jgi:hypothetical protein